MPVNIFLAKESIEFPPTFIGRKSIKSIEIVNNSENATPFEWMPIGSQLADENNEEHPSLKIVDIFPMQGELQPQTVTKVDLIFKPEDTNNDDVEIVKEIFIKLALKLSIFQNYHPSINVKGKVLGPSFQLDHKFVNINEVFVGEAMSIEINLKNIGVISGKYVFHRIQSPNDGIIKVSSESDVLKAGEVKKIKIKFQARRIGKFIDEGVFRIKNGDEIKFAIQGLVKPLEIIHKPCSFAFTAASICAPQMQFLKLINQSPFDVDISIEIENSGIDDPLEFLEFFKGNSTSRNNSISKSPSFVSMDSNDNNITTESCSSLSTRTSIKNFMERNGEMEQLRDVLATTIEYEIVEIFNRIDDYLERKEIVSSIICMLFDDKLRNEFESKHVVEMLVEMLIESIKECDFIKFNDKNWKLPDNPRQIECNKKHTSLSAGQFEDVKIFVIPNCFGKFTRNLKIQALLSSVTNRNQIDATVITVPILIDCQAADIKIYNETNEITGCIDCPISFDIHIENLSEVDGFYSFEKTADSELELKVDHKFYIKGKTKKIVNLIAIPRVSGQIIKHLNITALGSNRKYPITIECKSLPHDIIINPRKIFKSDLDVLKKDDTRVFIENRSKTKARFFIKLEHDNQCFSINPSGGILSSKQCILIMLEKFFYDPGDYNDTLIVEIVNSKIIKIPIKCTAKKLPIIIEPSFTNVIDFGTLFTSKNSSSLDYTFTNGGKISYTIFIILKNRRKWNEIFYTIEPNRFELSPNCSQVVKFSLNTVNALSCVDELTIEGCSIHFPIRELIWESKMKANVIKPTINFSSNKLIFNCYYGREDDLMDSLCIANDSSLPISVTLKIFGDFYIYISRLNVSSQKVEISLKSKESRMIYINFNCSQLKNFNKSRTIDGEIRVYLSARLHTTIKLLANLIYPEIELSTNAVNIIANKQPCSSSVVITNPSERLNASFELTFKDNSIVPICENRQEDNQKIMQCLMKHKCNLNDKFFMHNPCYDEISSNVDDKCQINDLHNSKSVTNDDRYREIDDSMEFFEFINDKIPENCFSRQASTTNGCLLSLSETTGVLNPNESRLVTISFPGSKKAFRFSSTISCQVMGGSCYDINVDMTNCNPNVLITKTNFEISNAWQKISIDKLDISSLHPIRNKIKIISPRYTSAANELIEGYAKSNMKNQSEFILDENSDCNVKLSIFGGCKPIFEAELSIVVNEMSPIPVTFYGKNSMPMATLIDISRTSLYDMNKPFEYECLRDMYKYVDRINISDKVLNMEDVERAKLKFQQQNAEMETKMAKNSVKKHKTEVKNISTMKPELIDNRTMGDNGDMMPKAFELFYNSCGCAAWCEKPFEMYSGKMLQILDEELEKCDFLALDYPNEYPQTSEIISYMAQHGFTKSLKANEIFNIYSRIYEQHVVEKAKNCTRHDDSIVVPLPLIVPEYKLDIGCVKINEIYEKVIRVYVHDNSISAAIRCETFIPDFCVEFLQYSECNRLFKIVNYKLAQEAVKYINRRERSIDCAVKRCHSFDFIEGKVHSRRISKTREELDQINKIYNEKMSTKVKRDERNQFTMTEIFSKNFADSKIVEFKIVFSPKAGSYDDDVDFDEILYLDLHLGPQIPIHVTAKITDTESDFFN